MRWVVAVSTRADAAADHHRKLPMLMADVFEQANGLPVDVGNLRRTVAELGAPVGACAPGRTLEHHAGAELHGDAHVRGVVTAQRGLAARAAEKIESGEVRQLEALVEDKRGLDAAVGNEERVAELRQRLAV